MTKLSPKHTPAPWRLGKTVGIRHTVLALNDLGHDVTICRASSKDFDEKTNGANASLIAAAPDLLETVKRMAKLLESIERETKYCTKVTQDAAYELIKKARGES